MLNKIFLKLDAVKGESKSPRHFGEIELSGLTWGNDHQHNESSGGGKSLMNDLTITKKTDTTSPILKAAWTDGRNLGDGILTFEEIAAAGGLIRSAVFSLKSLLIEYVTLVGAGKEETLGLNFESVKVIRI
jgi:type VI protein secretion system component Hcp